MIQTSNSITHKWWIPRLYTIPEFNSQSRVVEQATVYLQSSTGEFTDSDGDSKILEDMMSFECEFDTSNLSSFTSWEELTEDQVLGWCGITTNSVTGIAKTHMDEFEKKLLYQKSILQNPRDYSSPLWWADRTEE